MAKKPEDRYQTPAELLKDLARPSMTRGGAAEEVYSAITEESSSDVAEPMRPKRKSPPGVLPPKKAAQKVDDDKPGLDWDTLRPIAIGAAILLAIIALGVMFAGMSDSFNFGGGASAPVANERPKDDGRSLVQSPNMQGTAAPNYTPAVTTPGTVVVTTPGTNPDPSQAAPTSPNPGGNQTVTNPNTQAQNPASLANTSRTFDADAIPDWSTAPSSVDSGSAGTDASTQSPSTPGSKSANTSRFATFTVGPGAPSKTHFQGLAKALSNVPRDGASITLAGPGPFLVPEISLKQIRRVVLQASPGPRPILLVRPAEGQLTAGLSLAEGLLELDGLDFVLDRAAFAGSDPVRMVASIDGKLTVRNTSFTVWGAGAAPVRAIHFDSVLEPQGLAPALEPQLLLDRVFVRGNDVIALAVARPNADVVVRDSLLVGGAQPVLSISGTLPEALASATGERPRRAIRVVGSTILAQKTAIQATADDAEIPPTTAIAFQNSVAAAASGDAQFLDGSTWPIAGPDATSGLMTNLYFTLTDSLIVRFSQLANLGENSAFQAREPGDWVTLWKREVDANQFASVAWPSEFPADLSFASASALSSASLPAGSATGCDVSALSELSDASRRWLTAISAHPIPPDSSFGAAPAMVVKFDASKQGDFGTFLHKGDWPAGTVIEVTGNGLRQMSPVRLAGKSWKIACRQPQEGTPLSFSPKSVSYDAAALIDVDGGDVEIESLRVQLPASSKTPLTSLIVGRGGKLTLIDVTLQGLWNDTKALESLLTWSGGESPAALVCRDCFFINGGNAVQLDLGTNNGYFTNCLLVTRGHALELRPGSLPAGAAAGSLVAEQSTISAAHGAFHVQSSASGAELSPHRLFVDRCVIAAPLPLRADEGAAAVLRLADPATDLTRIEWWGTENGIAPEIKSLIRGDGEPPAESTEAGRERWQATWAAEQDSRLLTGVGGVVMKLETGSKSGPVKPAQFALDPIARAQTWAIDGTAIGADIQQIDAALPAAKSKAAGKTSPPPKRTNLPNTF
jgi:hypothetical protein